MLMLNVYHNIFLYNELYVLDFCMLLKLEASFV